MGEKGLRGLPDHLSPIPQTHMPKGEKPTPARCPLTSPKGGTHMYTQKTNKQINNKSNL